MKEAHRVYFQETRSSRNEEADLVGFFFCYDRNPCCRALIRTEMLVIPQTYYFDSGENPNILLHGYNAKLPIGVIPKLGLGRSLPVVAGVCFLTDSKADADKVRKWSTQSREAAPWYQHEEIGYNYRMSNVIAGVVRGQIPYLQSHIDQKRSIYERYKDGLKDLPVSMNPYDAKKSRPNFWLSCLLIDKDAMAPAVRGDKNYLYQSVAGKSSPQEILDMISAINAEGRPIWKNIFLPYLEKRFKRQ